MFYEEQQAIKKFQNFVIFANSENSLKILEEGKEAGLNGKSNKWVIGKNWMC